MNENEIIDRCLKHFEAHPMFYTDDEKFVFSCGVIQAIKEIKKEEND